MHVSLFITCFNDTLFPETGKAAVRVLERLGHMVEFRPEQTCCGQMHHNSGYRPEALSLARRFVTTFRDAENIVVPSTSCTTMIRQQYRFLAQLADDAELDQNLDALLPRVFEFTEFITRRLGLMEVGAYFPHRVTYHASCNSLRGLGLREEPERTLAQRTRAGFCGAAAKGRLLRFRWNVFSEERRNQLSDAGRQNPSGARHGRRDLLRRRQFVPDAYRRRSLPA